MAYNRINFDDVLMENPLSSMANFARTTSELSDLVAEFIDNSLQSFLTHKKDLPNPPVGEKQCKVIIHYDESSKTLVVEDNAYGMNEEEFRRANSFRTRTKKEISEDKIRLSRYGIGMKRAIFNLGRRARISTKEYGSNKLFVSIIDLERIENDIPEIQAWYEPDQQLKDHYTKIEIYECPDELFQGNEIKKAKVSLSRTYTEFIGKGDLKINFLTENIEQFDPELLKDEFGNEIKVFLTENELQFNYNGQRYTFAGWVGVLKDMDTTKATSQAGLDFRSPSGRSVRLAYRTTTLLGGVSTYPYRRIVGQFITSDNWKESVNKTGYVNDATFMEKVERVLISNTKFCQMKKLADTRIRTAKKVDPFDQAITVKPTSAAASNRQPLNTGSAPVSKATSPTAAPAVSATTNFVSNSSTPEKEIEVKTDNGKLTFKVNLRKREASLSNIFQFQSEDKEAIRVTLDLSDPVYAQLRVDENAIHVLERIALAMGEAKLQTNKRANPSLEDFLNFFSEGLEKWLTKEKLPS